MGDLYIFGLPVSLGTMIYQAIIFTVLVFLLKKFVIKKLVKVIELRKDYIENQLALTERYKVEARQDAEAYILSILQTKKEAQEIFEHSRKEAHLIIKDAEKVAYEVLRNIKMDSINARSLSPPPKEKTRGRKR